MADRPARIDSVKALMWGLIWFIFATIFMWYYRLIPQSAFTVEVSGYVTLLNVLILHAAVWVSVGVMMFAMGAMCGSSVKAGDMFGRVLYARSPLYLLFVPLAWRGFRVPFSVMMYDPAKAVEQYPALIIPYLAAAAVVGVWFVYWNYRAFAAASHRNSIAVLAAFVAALPLSYLLAGAVLDALCKGLIG